MIFFYKFRKHTKYGPGFFAMNFYVFVGCAVVASLAKQILGSVYDNWYKYLALVIVAFILSEIVKIFSSFFSE